MDENNYPTRQDVMTSQYMAGRVRRYHTWPVLHQETVAEHSMGVLTIYREVFGLSTMSVVKYIMDHDLPELHVGDTPFPAKRLYPKLKEALDAAERPARSALGLPTEYSVTPLEKHQIKICDLLQMWQFGRAEMRMGNTFAMPIIADTAKAALDLASELDRNDGKGLLACVKDWMMRESAR